ncbi:bZIP transcription factor [Colletotrichum navitas]|uniref:BZIP transcription factor n=1 Tax=Colletotrichum navitas TaxID=681940 RepID=A0AAD8PQT8_9PEZI|nr:bZIP transcription factor [Colletotrichum navitas]KAK1574069.1 bZIP transcription factor [Colletotrichum navitas]
MDYYSASGASTSEQGGLPGRAASFKPTPNSFANSTDRTKSQQKEHEQQQQRTQFLFHQQQQRLQQPIGPRADSSQSAFVSLSALNSAHGAPPSVVDRHSSTSTQSPSGWPDSPVSNVTDSLSSPTSSVISPPAPPIDPLLLGSAKGTEGPRTEDASEAPKRRRGRPRLSDASPETASAVAPTPTKVQKKSASRRTSTASASGVDEHADGHSGSTVNDKKNRIRARNREAAYKCRQKKQKGIEELQTQEAVMENINKSLNSEAAQLRGEILMLKNMVLQHGGCGCPYIEEYISGAAQNLVQSSMAASASAAGGGMQMHSQDCRNGTGEEGYIDWKLFDMDTKADMPSLESESGFSGYDDLASHSARAHSQEVSMD